MTPSTFGILLVLLGAIWSFIHRRGSTRRSNDQKLPPGPPPLPLIGNLHLLGTHPHRSFQKLSQKYGPIMFLRLGSVPTVVISSPEANELFLKTNDLTFANRPKTQVSKYYSSGLKGIAFSDYGPYWRNARKLCTLELLSGVKVESYADMRREEMGLLVESIKAAAAPLGGQVVDLSEMVQRLIEDMTFRMVFGRRSNHSGDLREAVHELLELIGDFNISDYLPLLAPFDLQGFSRRIKKVKRILDTMLEKVLEEHGKEASINTAPHKDFIHILLSLMNDSSSNQPELSYSIDRDNIKAITLDIVAAALDTTAIAIEWIMTEIIRHPRVMRKVQEEIKNVVGEDGIIVEDKDLDKFEYLEMVIKESLRLHPAGPFLIPRESNEETVVNGYFIPKKSTILVNVWALGRDPNVWSENAEEFLPERFSGSGIDLRGKHFQLMPFGTGRRGCPGIHLGLKNIRLVVSQLVHCFDWELPNGISPDEIDMREKFSLVSPRVEHLFAVPRYRLHI